MNLYYVDITKSEFCNDIAIRFCWDPVNLPSVCPCNEDFTVKYAFHCPKRPMTNKRPKNTTT